MPIAIIRYNVDKQTNRIAPIPMALPISPRSCSMDKKYAETENLLE